MISVSVIVFFWGGGSNDRDGEAEYGICELQCVVVKGGGFEVSNLVMCLK